MGKLSLQTKIYLFSTLAAGIILFAVAVMRWNWQETWIHTIILSVLGGLTLLFKVEGSTNRTHYDITFLVYGFTLILFGAPTAVIVILVAHIIEWIWHRYPWYIQSFNIASYIIVAEATNTLYEFANPLRTVDTMQGIFGLLLAMALFTLFNHLMIGLIVWLARGENFIHSGIFQFFPLMLDWVMLCMGAGVAVVWNYNPYAVIPVLMPLYLMYSTLRVPALERQVEIDSKTGIFNQKYFLAGLETELQRAARFGRPVTVVMADMDLLRNINNTYGHLAGDEVLIGIAKILKEQSREYDIVARFGGEEFAILMPETTPEEVYPKVQEIRLAIENARFTVPTSVTPIKATMSFGVAGRQEGLDARDMIHNADLALYHAKLSGRNRVIIFSNEGYTHDDRLQFPLESEPSWVKPEAERNPGQTPPTHADRQPGVEPKTQPSRSLEAGNNSPRLRKNKKPWVNVYILDLALIALSLFLFSVIDYPPVDWSGVLVFILLVAATEWASIDIYIRNTAVSTSTVPLIGGILLFGPWGALTMSLMIALVALIKHKSPFSRFIFNTANQLLASMTCILLIQWATGTYFWNLSMPIQILISSIAAMLVYWMTSFCIAIGVSISYQEPILQIWNEKFRWLAPYYLGVGVIAYALIFSYLHSGVLGTVVILIPLVLLRVSYKQFIERTKDTVNELKIKNETLQEHSGEIIRLNDGLLDTLAEVIDLRDPYILGHSRQVTKYAVSIAQQMGLSARQIEDIRRASLMHDVGKLGIDDGLLAKPSSLNAAEYAIMKRHVRVGADLLQKSQSLQSLIPIVLHHHERYDGKGYPDQLKGTEIPLEARIVCLADSVEAMASDRPYRLAFEFEKILEEVRHCSGSQFDPEVVKAFEKLAAFMGPALVNNIHQGPPNPMPALS